MKQKLKNISLMLLPTIMLLGCDANAMAAIKGSKNVIETEYSIKDFNSIQMSNAFTAEVIRSEEYRVVVKYSENIADYLEINKNNKTLSLGLKSDYKYQNANLSAKIYLPDIKRIEANGACEINIPEFSAKDLELDLSGASGFNGKLNIDGTLTIDASGASKIKIEGKAQNTFLEFSGATKFNGKDMTIIEDTAIDGSGASNIDLIANGEIKLKLSGASKFYNYGDGAVIERDISGASTVKNKQN